MHAFQYAFVPLNKEGLLLDLSSGNS